MKSFALFPARGGSKRLPRKNILPLAGKPLLAYPVEVARQSGVFARLIVSTEDAEIAQVAHAAGAEVMGRGPGLAEDHVGVNQVLLDVLAQLAARGEAYDAVCVIYPTAALITPHDLVASEALLRPADVDFVLAVAEYAHSPWQGLEEDGGYLKLRFPEMGRRQSQDVPHLVVNSGTLHWAKVPAFKREEEFYGARLKGYPLPADRAVDINTEGDLKLAEAIWLSRQGRGADA